MLDRRTDPPNYMQGGKSNATFCAVIHKCLNNSNINVLFVTFSTEDANFRKMKTLLGNVRITYIADPEKLTITLGDNCTIHFKADLDKRTYETK